MSLAAELRSVTHRFGSTTVLEGVDLEIGSAEAVALLGRSGSGKTTLLNLVAGLLTPDSGEVRVGSERVDNLSAGERAALRRNQIGFVFQQFNLLPTLTVVENLEFPAALAGRPVDRAALRADLAKLGLPGTADRFPTELSGGEQQRVAVLRALTHGPRLVLADEPTANLDVETARDVMALLRERTNERGAALLLVTHSSDLSVTLDRAYRIEGARLVAQ